MLKVTEELDKYISLVALDFFGQTHNISYMASVEYSRQIKIRSGIIALLKLYKGIPLEAFEQEILDKYLLENDYKTELELCIALMAYKIGMESWDIVNNIRLKIFELEWQRDSSTFAESSKTREYLESLDEYITALRHAVSWDHPISVITPNDRKRINPTMNFNSDCFIEYTPKIISLLQKLTKKSKNCKK